MSDPPTFSQRNVVLQASPSDSQHRMYCNTRREGLETSVDFSCSTAAMYVQSQSDCRGHMTMWNAEWNVLGMCVLSQLSQFYTCCILSLRCLLVSRASHVPTALIWSGHSRLEGSCPLSRPIEASTRHLSRQLPN